MKTDLIVKQIRAVRAAHAKKFNYNIADICDDVKKKGIKANRKTVNRETKKE